MTVFKIKNILIKNKACLSIVIILCCVYTQYNEETKTNSYNWTYSKYTE